MATPPAVQCAGQLVQHEGEEYLVIKEGRACILKPPAERAATQGPRKDLKPEDESQSVFYNPIQQFNRDLTVLAIHTYGEHVLALEKQKHEKRKQRAQGGAGRNRKRKREEDENESAKEQQVSNVDSTEAKPAGAENQQASESHNHQTDPPHSFTILDALSASGLRALRYASEIPLVTRVVANDLSDSAIQSMKLNIGYNGLENLIQPNNGDARAYMYSILNGPNGQKKELKESHVGKFDVVDLDPYGTAAPFMDAAVQAVKEGGLLCITCTDAGVWASGGYPEKTFSLYGGVPMKGVHSHEGGLRLILHGVAASAAKYGLAIEPLLSLSVDFYARLFVRIHRSPAEVKFISGNTMLVYNCDSGCGAWKTQPLVQTREKLDKKGNPFYNFGVAQGPTAGPYCEHCGFKTHLAGPMWAGPLHNPHFIQRILDLLPSVDKEVYKTTSRIEGMLTTALEEDLSLELTPGETRSPSPAAPSGDAAIVTATQGAAEQASPIIPRVDPNLREPYPFYFSLSQVSKVLHTTTVDFDAFRGALRHLGYRCSRSHAKPSTIRTDAPWAVIWEIMREWVRQKSPIKEGALRPKTAGAAIMAKSRENLHQQRKTNNSDNQQLEQLKKELISAAENGTDLSDLVTKVEAALYRSTSRNGATFPESHPSNGQVGQKQEQEQQKDGSQPQPQPQEPASSHDNEHTSSSSTRNTYSDLKVIFDETLGREKRPRKLVRYQMNPRANWGPLNRASKG